MSSILDIVTAISADLVAKIAAAGLPPLVDGQIVIGRDKADEISAPPRVVFIPTAFRFETRSNPVSYAVQQPGSPLNPGSGVRSFTMTQYGGGYTGTPTVTIGAPDLTGGVQATATATVTSNGAISGLVVTNSGSGYSTVPTVTISGTGTQAAALANLQQPSTALTVIQQTAFLTEVHRFEVLVWGVTSNGTTLTPDPVLDYAATQRLYSQVLASSQTVFPNVHIPSGGQWFDAQSSSMQRDVLGRMASFSLEFKLPVLREPMVPLTGPSIQFVPPQTQPAPTLYMIGSSGSVSITGATNAHPIVITTATAHGLTTGNSVSIAQVGGNTAANGIFAVNVLTSTTFELNGTTGNGTYTGSGLVFAESA